MWQWLKSRLRNRGKNTDYVPEVAQGLSTSVLEILKMGVQLSNVDPANLDEEDREFFLGYVAGCSDVLAQACGAEGGESLSMTTTMRVLFDLFGPDLGLQHFELADNYMSTRSPTFMKGFEFGGKDANGVLDKKMPWAFIKRYRPETYGE